MEINGPDDRQLLELAKAGDWASVLERAQSHPEEIDIVDRLERTVFHFVCRHGAPLSVLQLLMQIDKDQHSQDLDARSVLRRTRTGRTTLMLAICDRQVPLVGKLVESVPELISRKDWDGDTAGRYAMYFARYDTVAALEMAEILLNKDPLLRHDTNEAGETMTSELLRRSKSQFDQYVRSYPDYGGSVAFRSLFHCCLHGSPKEEPGEATPLLHWLLQCHTFPTRYLERALELRPQLIDDKDADGNSPLHVAASNLGPSKDRSWETISLLLKKDPSSAGERNNDGFLPLQLAIQSSEEDENNTRHERVCDTLFYAYPAAVESFGLQEGMYPRVLAKAARNSSTLFQVLTAKPNIVQWAADTASSL